MNKLSYDDVLDQQIFSYKVTKDRKVFIYWNNRQVKILKGKQANKLISKINRANDRETQLLLAKVTGNFKRGNE